MFELKIHALSKKINQKMSENVKETRSLALTPTWSVASVLTIFVAVSLIVERSIHRLSNWLRKTNRKPLLAAVEKMKEELMLLGFISLLLTATSGIISNICISTKFYNTAFAPCTKAEIDEQLEENLSMGRQLFTAFIVPHSIRRGLNVLNRNACKEGHEPFLSYEGLEQLHRFIFVMAVTHISYSCLTMLLAIVKIHSWRIWEDEAHMDRHDSLHEITREMTMRRQSTFVKFHASNPLVKNSSLIWVTCCFRQFGRSVVRADYLTLRRGFIMIGLGLALQVLMFELKIHALSKKINQKMSENVKETRSLALTPTWSVASVLTIFVAVSLIVERSIHRLSNWLRKTNRKPLLAAVEKMKEELMLLGFISLLLTATSGIISNICISTKFYNTAFAPCTKAEIDEQLEENLSMGRQLFTAFIVPHSIRRGLNVLNRNACKEGHEPFLSYEGLEQLHRFIFVMAVTHISYSCLTMLLAIVKIHSWRIWEDEAHMDRHDSLHEITREMTMRRQSTFVKFHASNPLVKNSSLIWVTCCFRQFGRSVVRADYLTLRRGFIMNHNLTSKYDFHSYMIRSMEEEFQRIVGVSGPLWGFVVAFMLFNVKGSNLYFWISIIPITLVLLVGTKLQHVIATLALESAGITGFFSGTRLKPRDELFWFKKPELLLSLIHFILFQNAFELASFFWFWWQFGYNSCFIKNHMLVYLRLILGFAGQFLCSYSTLPLYALVTQMGTNYKAALIPQRIRETIHGWGKAARRKRRHGMFPDDSTVHTDTSTILSVEEYDQHSVLDSPRFAPVPRTRTEIELQPPASIITTQFANETSSRVGTPLLRPSASVSVSSNFQLDIVPRSSSLPVRRD